MDELDPQYRELSPSAAEQRRQAFLEGPFLTYVGAVLDAEPQFNSGLLVVAQYWDDEAVDAVQAQMLWSVLPEVDAHAALSEPEREPTSEHEGWDELNRPGDLREGLQIGTEIEPSWWQIWDSNGEAITLFACYCEGIGHQAMPWYDIYRPLVRIERTPTGPTLNFVGTKYRPWLDGVKALESGVPEGDTPDFDLMFRIYGD